MCNCQREGEIFIFDHCDYCDYEFVHLIMSWSSFFINKKFNLFLNMSDFFQEARQTIRPNLSLSATPLFVYVSTVVKG